MRTLREAFHNDLLEIVFRGTWLRWYIRVRVTAAPAVGIVAAAIAITLGGCTGTVKVEPTDLSAVEIGANRRSVEKAVGKPVKVYESQGETVAAYQYNRGGVRHYDVGKSPATLKLEEKLLIAPIALPIAHIIASMVERHKLRESQRAWLCITYLEDHSVAGVKYNGQLECGPQGKLAGDMIRETPAATPPRATVATGLPSAVTVQPRRSVDPAGRQRIEDYLENNKREFELAMLDFQAGSRGSRRSRQPHIMSYDVVEANERRIIIKLTYGVGPLPQRAETKLFLVHWIGSRLKIVSQKDAPRKEVIF